MPRLLASGALAWLDEDPDISLKSAKLLQKGQSVKIKYKMQLQASINLDSPSLILNLAFHRLLFFSESARLIAL